MGISAKERGLTGECLLSGLAGAIKEAVMRKRGEWNALGKLTVALTLWCILSLCHHRTAWAEEVPDGTLTLVVVDSATQAPLADAVAMVRRYYVEGRDDAEYVTDSEGRCEVTYPGTGLTTLRIAVETEGFVPVSVDWNTRKGPGGNEVVPERFVVPLDKGTSIGGKVLNEDGDPVQSVRVNIMLANDGERIHHSLGDEILTTDAEGKWRCDRVPPKLARLWMNLEHADYVSSEVWNTIPVPPIGELRDFSAVMVLKSGLTVSGFVRDEDGKPIKRARVKVGERYSGGGEVATDGEGFFEVKNCGAGSLQVAVEARRMAPLVRALLSEEMSQPLELTLAAGRELRLRVVDTEGGPVDGVRISVQYNGADIDAKLRTGKDGTVAWSSAPLDTVTLAFYRKDFARIEGVEVSPDGTQHEVTLPAPLRIAGTVTDKATGAPIEAFRVVPVLDWLNGGTPYVSRGSAFDAEDGRFDWETDRTDTGHYVRIEADGYMPAMTDMFRVGDDDVLDVALALEKGDSIRGVVRGTDGGPIEGADVLLCTAMQSVQLANGQMSRADATLRVTTDADGSFAFAPDRDAYDLVVLHDDGYAQVSGETLAQSGEIRIEPWGRVEGRLVQDGEPVPSYNVRMGPTTLYAPDRPHLYSQYYTATGADGDFVFERVAPGLYSLAPRLGPWEDSVLTSAPSIPLSVAPGETAKADMGVGGCMIVGKAVLPEGMERAMAWDCGINYLVAMKDGGPVPDAIGSLDFDWRNGWDDAWTSSRAGGVYLSTLHKHLLKLDKDGSFRINNVARGAHELVLRIYDPPQGGG